MPPSDVVERINELQERCGIAPSTQPHITVKAQPGLDDPSRWHSSIVRAARDTHPFPVQLGRIDSFGEEIIFLRVESPALIELHCTILRVLQAVGIDDRSEYEGGAFVPHLTLAAAFAGASADQLRAVRSAFSTETWPAFTAHSLVAFHRAGPTAPYVPVESWSFDGLGR